MDGTIKRQAIITSIKQLAKDVYSMWIEDSHIASIARPGQFVSLYCRSNNRLLPRPISICEINETKTSIRLVYRVMGDGTKEFSGYKENETIEVMGPLGNGFTLEDKKAILVGGGIGIPPMLELAKHLPGEKIIVLGYRDITFLEEDFKELGQVYIATEDGSIGTKGNVIDAIRENNLEGQIIYACGPTPMLRGLKQYGQEKGIRTQLSLEERMACGIGACLACVCKSKETDSHTHVHNKRICKEGPVFYGEDIILTH